MHDKGFFFSSSLNKVLTLYTLTSEFIFYKLFSVYFQMYSQGEFVWISNYLYSGDCFLCSFDLNILFIGDIVIEIRCYSLFDVKMVKGNPNCFAIQNEYAKESIQK